MLLSGHGQFDSFLIVLACVAAAVPVTVVLFRVLESNAYFKMKGWPFFESMPMHGGDATAFEHHMKIGQEGTSSPTQTSGSETTIIFGGAAAGFLAAFLAALSAFHWSYHPQFLLPEDWLLGHWFVLNSAEPDLLAQWQFKKDSQTGHVTVQGDVWRITNISVPTRSQDHDKLPSFGPFNIELLSDGKLSFAYESDFGNGEAKFSQAFGYLGTYEDDPELTPADETDSGEILLHKGPVNVRSQRIQRLLFAGGVAIFYSWLTAALAYFLFRFLESHAYSKTGRWVFGGAIAFYYVFILTLANAGSLQPFVPRVSEADISGEWQIEYLENRDRYGYMTVSEDNAGWALDFALAKQNLNERRIRPRAQSAEPVYARIDLDEQSIEFNYTTSVGTGTARLKEAQGLVGRFSDREAPVESEANWGNLVAVKRQ